MIRHRLTQLIVAILAILLVGQTAAPRESSSALAAQAQSRAGLVIQYADGSTNTFCFSFEGESISGLELLQKTGLPLKYEGYGAMGALICKIGPDGCEYPGEPCACKSYGPGGVYWGYYHLRGAAWKTSATGAGSYRVKPGEVDGWAWSAGKPPPVFTFDRLCTAGAGPLPETQATATAQPPPPPPPPPPSATRPLATRTATVRPRPPSTPTRTGATRTPTRPRPTATRTRTPLPTRTRASTATQRPSNPTLPPRTFTRAPTRVPTLAATPLKSPTTSQANLQGETIGVSLLMAGASRAVALGGSGVGSVE